jgi:hypothetical protein
VSTLPTISGSAYSLLPFTIIMTSSSLVNTVNVKDLAIVGRDQFITQHVYPPPGEWIQLSSHQAVVRLQFLRWQYLVFDFLLTQSIRPRAPIGIPTADQRCPDQSSLHPLYRERTRVGFHTRCSEQSIGRYAKLLRCPWDARCWQITTDIALRQNVIR